MGCIMESKSLVGSWIPLCSLVGSWMSCCCVHVFLVPGVEIVLSLHDGTLVCYGFEGVESSFHLDNHR